MSLQGEYYRIISEYQSDELELLFPAANHTSQDLYEKAYKISISQQPCTSSLRLGLILSYADLLNQLKNQPTMARKWLIDCVEETLPRLDDLDDKQYKEAISILQLMRENASIYEDDD